MTQQTAVTINEFRRMIDAVCVMIYGNLHSCPKTASDLTVNHHSGMPELSPAEQQWAEQQLDRMFQENFVITVSPAYYHNDNQHGAVVPPAAITNTLLEDFDVIKKSIPKDMRIAGPNFFARPKQRYQKKGLENGSNSFYVPSGGLHTLYELLCLLEDRLIYNEAPEKPIIIENIDHYWDASIFYVQHAIGMELTADQLRENFNIYIADSRVEAIDLANTLTLPEVTPHSSVDTQQRSSDDIYENMVDADSKGRVIPSQNKLNIEDGSIFLVATSKTRKIREIQAVFDAMGMDVHVMPITQFAGQLREAPEKSSTYEGNSQEKIEAGLEAMAAMDDWEATLVANGIDPAKTYILSEDSGVAFNEAALSRYIYETKEAENGTVSRQIESMLQFLRKGWTGSMPGPELSPVANSLDGFANYARLMQNLLTKIESEEGREADWTLTQFSNLALAPLSQIKDMSFDEVQNMTPEAYHYSGTNQMGLIKGDPRPADAKKLTLDNFTCPLPYDGRPTADTFAEIEAEEQSNGIAWHQRFKAASSVRTSAVTALGRSTGLHFGRVSPEEKVSNSQFHTMLLGDSEHAQELTLKNCRISIADEALQHPTLQNMEELVNGADGYVIMPSDPGTTQEQQDVAFYEKLLMMYSLTVAKELYPRDISKPIIVYNPLDDNGAPLDPQLTSLSTIFYDLYNLGKIGKEPQFVYNEAKTPAEVVAIMQSERAHHFKRADMDDNAFRGVEIAAQVYDTPESGNSEKAPAETNRFNVAIFCSASARSKEFNQQAHDLSFDLAQNNFGLVYGAGDKFVMGQVWEGVIDARFHHWMDSLENSDALSKMLQILESGGTLPRLRENADAPADDITLLKQADIKDKITLLRDYAQEEYATLLEDYPLIGSSTDFILQKEAENWEAMTDHMSHFFEANTIYERMDYLLKTSDAFGILPGGHGTVQELSAVMLAKEKALQGDEETLKAYPGILDKPLVLLDPDVQDPNSPDASATRRFWQVVKDELLTQERCDRLGIHIVDSVDAMQDIFEQTRLTRIEQSGTNLMPGDEAWDIADYARFEHRREGLTFGKLAA